MAQMTITLEHGLVTGKGTPDEARHMEVTLRELTSKDIIDAQLAAERVVMAENGKAVAYVSEVLYGLELLRRQIAQIGTMPGPLTVKQIHQFHPDDFRLLSARADAMDGMLSEVAERGRDDADGGGTH
uniref:phage tail assembly protein n=1 Tax=Serratia marcescens TaxID=615 RepID=UPI001BCE4111|nr:phage tail assembly protein [Serratia marcescens]